MVNNNQPIKLNFNLSFTKLTDLSKLEAQRTNDLLILKPQLAFDPKIGDSDYPLFFDYARTKNPLAWEKSRLFYAEPKMDGVRGQFVIQYCKDSDSLKVYCLSRANRRLTSVDHIVNDLSANPYLLDYLRHYATNPATGQPSGTANLVLDSELYVKDAEFRYINGLTNRKISDSETSKLMAYIFQIYFADSQGNAIETVDPFNFEHWVYNKAHGLGLAENLYYSLAPRFHIASVEQLTTLANKLKAGHYEGLVLKSADYRHFDGRTKHWLKLKFRRTGTFKLLGVEYGEGKCAGTCGAIKIGDAIGQTTMVGTGMTDQDRDELASLSSLCLTQPIYVQVSYMTKTGSSLREPVYEGIRYDLNGRPQDQASLDIFTLR